MSASVGGFFDRINDEYFKQVERGEHDPECERRERLHLCHCAKRKRIARGVTSPPAMSYQSPLCDGCYSDVHHDGDGWRCDECATSWGSNDFDVPGEFMDDYGVITGADYERLGDRLIIEATQ